MSGNGSMGELLEPGEELDLHRAGDGPVGWLVDAGEVDVYALFDDESPVVGVARDYLFTVPEKEVLRALPQVEPLSDASTPRLVAVGRDAARLMPINAGLGSRAPAAAGEDGQILRTLAVWIERLAAAVAEEGPAIEAVDAVLYPGQSHSLLARERVAGSRGAWLRATAPLALYADPELVPVPREWLPIPHRWWLAAGPGTTVAQVEVSDAVALEPAEIHRGLESFHRLWLELLRRRLVAARRAERQRLAERTARLEDDQRYLMRRFSKVIDPDAEQLDASLPPLAACLRRIADLLGAAAPDPAADAAGVHDLIDPSRPLRERLDAFCRHARLRRRQVALRGAWWKGESSPLLVFRRGLDETPRPDEVREDDSQPLVILPGRPLLGGGSRYWDPRSAEESALSGRVDARFASGLEGVAHVFDRVLPEAPIGPGGLARFLFPAARRELAAIFAFVLLASLVGLLIPIATGLVIDVTIPSHQTHQLYLIGAGLAITAFTAFAFRVCQDIAVLRLEGQITAALQPALLDRLLRLPNTFFRRFAAGDLAERARLLDALQRRLTEGAFSTLLSGTFALLHFGVLLAVSPVGAATTAFLLLLFAAVFVLLGRRQLDHWTSIQRLWGRISALVLDLVHGIRRLRLAGAEERLFVRWGHLSLEYRHHVVGNYNVQVIFAAFYRGFVFLAFAAVFWTLARYEGEALSTGRYLAFLASFTVLLSAAGDVFETLLGLAELLPLYRRAAPLLEAVPERRLGRAHPGVLEGRLEILDLVFRYVPGGPRVLDGVSLRAEPGESIALVGPSGSGKSTLLRLILGFEEPEAGGIYFDGRDLAGLDAREIRHQIGVVLQHDALIQGSIYDNIRGAREVGREQAREAARRAGIEAEIDALPQGLDTVISAEGHELSGGQIERLLLARALVGRPRMLLLDEATSSLDHAAQAAVVRELERLRLTRIAIAHRLATVESADRIYVMDRGRIVDSGTYSELMERGGVFARLVRRRD